VTATASGPPPAVERRAFSPFRLAGLTLRNRIIKSATYEGMSPGGRSSQALVEHHARLAEGGVGLTTVAYAAVMSEGRTFSGQLLMDDDQVPRLRPLTDAAPPRASSWSTAAGSASTGHPVTAGRPDPPGPSTPTARSAGWCGPAR
jgi:hypothetical protein